MLSYRIDTALHGGLVIAQSRRLELGDNIYEHYMPIGLSSTTVTQLANKAIEFGEKCKIRPITTLEVI